MADGSALTALEEGDIFPDTTIVRGKRLVIAGCDLVELADHYGTPLYVFDEASVLDRVRGYRDALKTAYRGGSTVCYASKAYSAPWLLQIMADEGLGLDIVSAGELYIG